MCFVTFFSCPMTFVALALFLLFGFLLSLWFRGNGRCIEGCTSIVSWQEFNCSFCIRPSWSWIGSRCSQLRSQPRLFKRECHQDSIDFIERYHYRIAAAVINPVQHFAFTNPVHQSWEPVCARLSIATSMPSGYMIFRTSVSTVRGILPELP